MKKARAELLRRIELAQDDRRCKGIGRVDYEHLCDELLAEGYRPDRLNIRRCEDDPTKYDKQSVYEASRLLTGEAEKPEAEDASAPATKARRRSRRTATVSAGMEE
jgi:hypothetical protein